jgi:ABC-type multidrug transport system ATPase subunit
MVGNELIRGVSGGERKRLNIATELVTNPSLIFLDEPTTGLDGFSAQSIMQTMLALAQNSRTVIATIHQPRSSIYSMFDYLMLLSEGRTMYYGRASEAVGYFSALGYICPSTFNPADFFIDFLSRDQRSANLEKISRARIASLGDAYAAREATQSFALPSARQSHAPSIDGERKYATGWLRQFQLLTLRSLREL